ncbi:hypothetical protein V3391_11180 [Luteimonas sp. SMYT11W]|uniref:Uncharacterized protein n=1 Tax=Luteimonas flava TaxID=3115822 RepID=A0ABU7WFM7_9GAMM
MSGDAVRRCHARGVIRHATSRIAREPLSQNIIKKGINASARFHRVHFEPAHTGISGVVKKESPTRPQRKSGCAVRDTFARLRDRFARKMRSLRTRRPTFASCIEGVDGRGATTSHDAAVTSSDRNAGNENRRVPLGTHRSMCTTFARRRQSSSPSICSA